MKIKFFAIVSFIALLIGIFIPCLIDFSFWFGEHIFTIFTFHYIEPKDIIGFWGGFLGATGAVLAIIYTYLQSIKNVKIYMTIYKSFTTGTHTVEEGISIYFKNCSNREITIKSVGVASNKGKYYANYGTKYFGYMKLKSNIKLGYREKKYVNYPLRKLVILINQIYVNDKHKINDCITLIATDISNDFYITKTKFRYKQFINTEDIPNDNHPSQRPDP